MAQKKFYFFGASHLGHMGLEAIVWYYGGWLWSGTPCKITNLTGLFIILRGNEQNLSFATPGIANTAPQKSWHTSWDDICNGLSERFARHVANLCIQPQYMNFATCFIAMLEALQQKQKKKASWHTNWPICMCFLLQGFEPLKTRVAKTIPRGFRKETCVV